MKCKKCGTLLAEYNQEKGICDECKNKTVSLKFLGWSYMIEGILSLLLCFCSIEFFHIISWGKSTLLLVGIIACILGIIKGSVLLIQKN